MGDEQAESLVTLTQLQEMEARYAPATRQVLLMSGAKPALRLRSEEVLALLRSYRRALAALEPFAEVASSMRRAEGKSVALHSAESDGHFGYLPIERFRHAAAVVREVKRG
jgi:hypothetical protein